jgi:hypothetical protein
VKIGLKTRGLDENRPTITNVNEGRRERMHAWNACHICTQYAIKMYYVIHESSWVTKYSLNTYASRLFLIM